jgi:phospholipid transport system transporter-binding protein
VSEAATLHGTDDGRFALKGALTLSTVTALRSQGRQSFSAATGDIVVDLGGIDRTDSGGLALLVDWLAWAQSARRKLTFTALPEALRALARVSDVEDLLAAS